MTTTAVGPERYNASLLIERNLDAGRADKPAFKAVDGTITYDELRRQVNRAGGLLRELGVAREHRVLLVLDDTTVFPILFLGAMRIGAVPVPVSHLDKADNLRHFVEDSYATVVAADAETLPRLRAALEGIPLRYLVRGGEGPDVVELDAGLVGPRMTTDVAPCQSGNDRLLPSP